MARSISFGDFDGVIFGEIEWVLGQFSTESKRAPQRTAMAHAPNPFRYDPSAEEIAILCDLRTALSGSSKISPSGRCRTLG
jgi:hypothetical protein